jgi:hypothetical protein
VRAGMETATNRRRSSVNLLTGGRKGRMWIHETGLVKTIDAVGARLASGESILPAECERVVEWLLGRQVASGRDGGMFVPSPGEYEAGVRLFTGERLRTRVATRNVLTLEAARILSALASERADVRKALSRTSVAMGHACFAASHCVIGECAHSSIAYMRGAASDRGGDHRKWIEDHLRVIRAHRDGKGRWKRFPFYYSLLALLEVGTPSANAELEYARPACRRVTGRAPSDDYASRRRRILERVLEGRPSSSPSLRARYGSEEDGGDPEAASGGTEPGLRGAS